MRCKNEGKGFFNNIFYLNSSLHSPIIVYSATAKSSICGPKNSYVRVIRSRLSTILSSRTRILIYSSIYLENISMIYLHTLIYSAINIPTFQSLSAQLISLLRTLLSLSNDGPMNYCVVEDIMSFNPLTILAFYSCSNCEMGSFPLFFCSSSAIWFSFLSKSCISFVKYSFPFTFPYESYFSYSFLLLSYFSYSYFPLSA